MMLVLVLMDPFNVMPVIVKSEQMLLFVDLLVMLMQLVNL
jgi:hypothetical protein